jgi:hypothetical protein
MNALEGLKLVKFDRPPFSAAEPWFRIVDEKGKVVGSGETEEAARQSAELAVRRARQRHRPGVV